MPQEHTADTGGQLDPISTALIRSDFDVARGYCEQMSGYPQEMWLTLIGTFERIYVTIHRDRDPKRANELLKEVRKDLPTALTRHLRLQLIRRSRKQV